MKKGAAEAAPLMFDSDPSDFLERVQFIETLLRLVLAGALVGLILLGSVNLLLGVGTPGLGRGNRFTSRVVDLIWRRGSLLDGRQRGILRSRCDEAVVGIGSAGGGR